jgi:hypothetical protein
MREKVLDHADASRIGLCWNCEYARHVEAKESSVYFLCERSLTDPTFPKYPRLPVLRCWGYFQGAEHHETISAPTAPATTEKKCPCCGRPFTCYQQEGCWCANVRLAAVALDVLRVRLRGLSMRGLPNERSSKVKGFNGKGRANARPQ